MKKAVVYARYSSDSQTEQSIEGQLRVCNEYAERNNIEILENFIDRAMTGTNDNRPEFQRMLKESKKKLWNYILVYKFDRFSRNKYESVIHKKELKDLGISVTSATELIPEAPEGIILESLLEGLNQYYSAELSQKVKRGLRETRIKGNFQGGNRPYGYNVENRKLVINEKEARVVRYIFNQYIIGYNCVEISKKLKRRGTHYIDNKSFSEKIIRKLINKEYYTGIYHCNGEYFHNIYPPIISRNIFKKVKNLKKVNSSGTHAKDLYIYRNKIYCKQCGDLFQASSGTTRQLLYYKYYACRNRKRKHLCSAGSYPKSHIENYLTSFLRSFIEKPFNIDAISKVLIKKYKQRKNLEQLNKFKQEKEKCSEYLKNILNAMENGIYNSSTNDRIKYLENRITELDAEILYEQNKDNPKFSKPYIRKYFLNSLKLDDYNFINYLINKIMIDEHTLDIYLNCPYDNNYTSFTLIKKVCHIEAYLENKIDFIISKEISIFI